MFRYTKSTLRLFSANKHTNRRFLSLHEDHLELSNAGDNNSKEYKFHYFWLRDHCRCSQCYNHRSHQINIDLLKLPFDIKPKFCEEIGDKLKIVWPDNHQTEYNLNFLKNLIEDRRKSKRQVMLWDAEKLASIKDASVPCKEYFEDPAGRKIVLQSFLKYGFAFVTEVEPTLEATEKVVRHTTLVQRTIFGEMWEVINDFALEDTAYSTISLDAHNDNTYFTEASGVMVFHMLEHVGTGGKTLLVDGFNAATNLKLSNPKAFNVLTKFPIESEFVGTELHFTSAEPVIKLHPVTGELMQIRYNHYDRAYLNSIPFENILDYYRAYMEFGTEIKKASNQWWLQLQPGNVLFIDNWRLLHGRAEYTGKRRLVGCYVTRRDWTCAAKVHGLSLY